MMMNDCLLLIIAILLLYSMISLSNGCTWNLGMGEIVDRMAADYRTTDSAFEKVAAFLNAAKHGETDRLRHFLDQGIVADVEVEEPDMLDYQRRALMLAASNGHDETVDFLLSRGADINAGAGESGTTALMFAALNNQAAMVAKLTSKGADIDAFNDFGSSAVMLAASKGHRDVVSLLMASGADLEGKDKNNDTALLLSVINNHRDVVELLLSPQNEEHWTTFDRDLHGSNDTITRREAYCRSQNSDGNDAFLEAVRMGNSKMAALLSYLRRDYHRSTNKFGQNALTVAALNCHSQLFDSFFGLKINTTALSIYSSCIGNATLMNMTILSGSSPRVANNLGETALHVAAKMGQTAMVRHLLDGTMTSPVDVDLQDRSPSLNTPLMVAVQSPRKAQDVVRFLLSRGADVNAKNSFGRTAIDLSACSRNFNIVKILLAKGSHFHDALEAAAAIGSANLARLLLNRGANVTEHALQSAVIGGHANLVKLFLRNSETAKLISNNVLKMAVRAVAGRKTDWIFSENRTESSRCWIKIAPPSVNRTSILRLLLDCHNRSDNIHDDAIFEAAKYGLTDVIRYLHYEKGASINGTNKDGLNLIAAAALAFQSETVSLLIEMGAPRNFSAEFLCAAGRGDVAALKLLFKNKKTLSSIRSEALVTAASFGHVKAVRLLLNNDVVNSSSSSPTIILTPAMAASKNGHVEILRLLANYNRSNLNAVNKDGWNAMRFAAENGRIQTVRFLLQIGADKANCKLSYRCQRGMEAAQRNETTTRPQWLDRVASQLLSELSTERQMKTMLLQKTTSSSSSSTRIFSNILLLITIFSMLVLL